MPTIKAVKMDEDLTIPIDQFQRLEFPIEVINKLSRFERALDELVTLGSHLLRWELESNSVNADESAYVLSFFKRALGLVDACALLIGNACIIPAKGLTRILLENLVQFEYLLLDLNKLPVKVIHLAIVEIAQQLYELEFLKRRLNPIQAEYLQQEINKLTALYEEPTFANFQSEIDACRYLEGRTLPPKWFKFSDGGRTFTDLMGKLNNSEFYKSAYNNLSDVVHSSGLVGDTIYHDSNTFRIRSIRSPIEAIDITVTISTITLKIYSEMLSRRKQAQKHNYLLTLQAWKNKYSDLYFFISGNRRS